MSKGTYDEGKTRFGVTENINGKVSKRGFNFLVNELRLFH